MLIAQNRDGDRVEATRDLPSGQYRCPMCASDVVVKRGRKVAAHFAHAVGADCPVSESESWRHLMAKKVVAEQLAARGWQTRIEVAHPRYGRRVDAAAKKPDAGGRMRYVAIEIQDSAIQVDTMKTRIAHDQRLNYDATVWLFTTHRAAALMRAEPDDEVRVPEEMLWVSNRYQQGVHVIDPEAERVHRIRLGGVHREGESYSWYEAGGELAGVDYPGYSPKTIKTVERRPGGFNLQLLPGRFDQWVGAFAPETG